MSKFSESMSVWSPSRLICEGLEVDIRLVSALFIENRFVIDLDRLLLSVDILVLYQ